MAGKSINLLQPEEISFTRKKRIFFLKIGTVFLVVFYCLLVVSIFSFWLVVQRESKTVADKIRVEQTRLSRLKEVESLQLLLKQRLSSLSEIVEIDKSDLKYWLNYLESLVPEGVALEDIQWSSDGQVKLSGTASNALALSDFLDNLKEATDRQKLVRSTLVSATRQKEGTYAFSLEILIEK